MDMNITLIIFRSNKIIWKKLEKNPIACKNKNMKPTPQSRIEILFKNLIYS